jgi:hypothetical protein
MAKVQISWRDNSDNEDSFKIFKSTNTPVTSSDAQIAEVTLASGQWNVSGTASNVALTSSNTTNSSTTGETFVISYDEDTPNTYFYGVAASNAVGDSLVVTSTGSVEVLA